MRAGGEQPYDDDAPRSPRRPPRRRPLVFFTVALPLLAAGFVLQPTDAGALCNIIPPAERTFPSTQGSVRSPIAAPGDEVTVEVGVCDDGPGFATDPADNTITITFLPEGDPDAVLTVTSGVTVEDCAFMDDKCHVLRFVMPPTTSATYPDGLAGPAEIRITNGQSAAVIGPLSQPRPDTTCDKQADTIFQHFTVLPPPNVFQELIDDPGTRILAALDGSGSLLVPFDYREVLPLGPAEPVAALLSGSTSIEAFQGSGQPIEIPDSTWVRSFTIDGRPVPPLLRATDAGNEVFGASDGAEGIVRVARSLGGEPPIYDLAHLRTSNGRGPVVIEGGNYEISGEVVAVPLANLRSTSATAAFSRDEDIEANLNGPPFSPDADVADDVVQIIDVATFTSTLTGRAASPIVNPITGGVVDASDDFVAFLESEAQQGGIDLNEDGQPATDHLLRVLTATGDTITSDVPAEALRGSPFPGVDRKPVAIDGDLVYFREPEVGFQAPSGFLLNGTGVDVSPDGRLIAATNAIAGGNCGEIRIQRRDGATGTIVLTSLPGVRTQCGITDGAEETVFSPSGSIVYVAAPGAGVVGAYRVSVSPDQIAVGGVGLQTTAAVAGASRVAVTPFTPDAPPLQKRASLYAVSPIGNSISAFDVSEGIAVQPTLALSKTLQHDVGCVPSATRVCIASFQSPRGVATSPDGRNVYVAVHGSDRVKAFSRLNDTSEIVELQDLVDNGNGGAFLDGAIDVAVSPDGRFVYALSQLEDAISIFSRDLMTGMLTFVDEITDGDPGVEGIDDGRSLVVSPDGIAVYATNSNAEVTAFDRNTATGLLNHNRTRGGFGAVPNAYLAVSPDSEHVYVQNADLDAGEIFARESALRAFDTATGETRPGLDAENSAAKLASVAPGHAAFIRPSVALGTLFPVVKLYVAATDSMAELDAASGFANKVALSSQIMALAAPEGLVVGDGDNDGSTFEDTLVVASLANPGAPPEIAGADAHEVGATDVCSGGPNDGDACDEQSDCPGGTCQGVAVSLKTRLFNFDGDADLALAVHRQGIPGSIEIGRNVVDFEVSGNLIAFRDSENGLFRMNCADPDEIPFDNPDGDCTDLVMRIYDLVTNQVIDTRQATIKCEQPGCEPGLPYKILGDSVAFLTREADQGGQDLDGDGSADDTVVQIYSVRSARTQIVKTFNGQFRLPPLPTTFIGAPIVYRDAAEGDLARDVNEDGDQDDVVVLVDGDQDGDGVFDSSDICVERADPDQEDSDEDGLGNACDPTPFCAPVAPEAPAAPPAEANACQDAVGKAAEKLFKNYAKAVTSCLDRIASGKLAGSPDDLCRGGLGLGTPPEDDKTERKIVAAVDAARKSIEKKCTALQLTQIDACGSNLNSLVSCLTSRAAFATALMTELAYGDVKAVGEPKRLACQKKIGKQAINYTAAAAGAMRNCLDRFNDGKISGDSAALCLGSDAPLGNVPPTDATAAMKLAKSAETLRDALAKSCEGQLPAPLDACGDDAASIAACNQCIGYRAAAIVIEGSYGP